MITVSINGTPYVPDVVSVTDGLNTFTVDLPVTVPSGATVLFNADDAQIEDASGNQLVDVTNASVTISGTAATITSVTAGTVANGQIPLSIAATGYSNGDTVYFVLHDAAQASPDQTEVLAGQASGGGSPLDSGSVAIVSGGITITLAGGIARQNVKVALVIDNGAASNVGVSGAFEVDTVAPAFVSAATDTVGSTWTLTFDEAVFGTEDTSDWTVTWTGASGQSVNSVTIDGTTSVVLSITGDAPVNGDTGLTVSYAGGDLKDIYDNALADFGPSSVTNNVPAAGSLTTTRIGDFQSHGTNTATPSFNIDLVAAGASTGEDIYFAYGPALYPSACTVNGNAATKLSTDAGSTGSGRCSVFRYTLQSGDIGASIAVQFTNSGPTTAHVFDAWLVENGTFIAAAANQQASGTAPLTVTPTAPALPNKVLVWGVGTGWNTMGYTAGATEVDTDGSLPTATTRSMTVGKADNVTAGAHTVTLTPGASGHLGIVAVTIAG